MITDELTLRPRYGEVDQMGYVYHANYVSYCHQARTELMRKIGIEDCFLEKNNFMMPVISFQIDYKKPVFYDELLTIKTIIREIPKVRLKFEFEIRNSKQELTGKAQSIVVFVEKNTRHPVVLPDFVHDVLEKKFNSVEIAATSN